MSLILDALRKAQEERKKIFVRAEKKRYFNFQRPRKPFYFILAGGICFGLVIFFLPVPKKTPPVNIKPVDMKKEPLQNPVKQTNDVEKKSIKEERTKLVELKKQELNTPKREHIKAIEKKEHNVYKEPNKTEGTTSSKMDEGPNVTIKKENEGNILKMFNQAISEAEKGRIDEAKRIYLKILEEKPDYIQALNNLGVLAMAQGNSKEALSYYRRILEKSPNYGKAYNNMALILLREGDRKLAEEYLKKAIEIDREGIEAYINLSALLRSEKRLTEAIKILEPIIKKGKEEPNLYLTYAIIKDEAGETKDAIFYYRQYLRLAGKSEERNKVLERVKVLEDRDFTKGP